MSIKIFKKQKNFRKKTDLFLSPEVYWRFFLGIEFLLTLTSLFFGWHLFRQVNKEFVLPSENVVSKIEMVKKARINKALEYFSAREKKSAEILNSHSPISDPSL